MVYDVHTLEAVELALHPRECNIQFFWLGKHSLMSEFTQPNINNTACGARCITLLQLSSTSTIVEPSLHMHTLYRVQLMYAVNRLINIFNRVVLVMYMCIF